MPPMTTLGMIPRAVAGSVTPSSICSVAYWTHTDCLSRRQSQLATQKGDLQGDVLFEPGFLIQIEMTDGQNLELAAGDTRGGFAGRHERDQRIMFRRHDQHRCLNPVHDANRPITQNREQDARRHVFLPDGPRWYQAPVPVVAIRLSETAYPRAADDRYPHRRTAECGSG